MRNTDMYIHNTKIKEVINSDVVNNIENVCRSYHLFSKIINNKPREIDKEEAHYAVISIDEIPYDIDPEEIIRRNARHEGSFFPENYAIKLTGEYPLSIIKEIINYCKNAELIMAICHDYNIPIPEKLDHAELVGIENFNEEIHNENLPEELRAKYKNKLNEYVKKYLKKPSESLDFYRSEKYDIKKSKLSNFIGYLNRKEQNVKLEQLFLGSSKVERIQIPEFIYEEFKKILKSSPKQYIILVIKLY